MERENEKDNLRQDPIYIPEIISHEEIINLQKYLPYPRWIKVFLLILIVSTIFTLFSLPRYIKADVYYKRGLDLLKKKEISPQEMKNAFILFKEAMREIPDSKNVNANLGYIYLFYGQFEKGMSIFSKLPLTKEEHDATLKTAEKIAESYKNSERYYIKAREAINNDDIKYAYSMAEEAIKESPMLKDAWILRTIILIMSGDIEAAQRLSDLFPLDGDEEETINKAIKKYKEINKNNP